MSSARSRLRGAGGGVGPSASAAAAASLQLDPDPAAAREARSWIVSALGDWPDAGVETARLLVTEVVTNAVLHARTQIELCVRPIGSRMRFEVADEHPAGPLHKHFQLDAATGRGLLLLDSMADEWGVARTARGKVVWFTLGPDCNAVAPAVATTGTVGVIADEVPSPPTTTASQEAARRAPVGSAVSSADGAPARPGIKVVMKALPIAVYLEAEQHNDALMREFALMAQAATGESSTLEQPRRLLELADAMRAAFGTANSSLRLEMEPALQSGRSTVDLEMVVPQRGLETLLVFAAELDDIDRFCEHGDLVTLASSPTVRRFRRWYCQQVANQMAGKPPQPWPGDA